MPELTQKQLQEVISRVTEQVMSEASGYEKAFEVAELRAHIAELGKMGAPTSAWEISYKTSSASIERLGSVAKLGGASAWEISYKTTSATIERTSK